MKKFFMLMIPLMLFAACGPKREIVKAIDLTDLDTTASPKVDFYQYATGGWRTKNPLKGEYSRYGSFNVLEELNQERLNSLFESMAKMRAEKGTVDQKISDLYKMAMDSVRRNELGAEPIREDIAAILAIGSKEELIAKLAEFDRTGADGGFYGGYVEADLMDSDNQIFYIGQGGLGMGDRDYYLEASNAALKEGYKAFLEKIFTLAGIDNPAGRAANALSVEDKIAEISWTRVQQRDMQKVYNPMSSAEIIAAYPGIFFDKYLEGRGIPAQEKIIVGEPSFFKGLSGYLDAADLEILKDYMLGQYVQGTCGALSDDFYTASWEFFSHQMSGATEQKPRWKRVMSVPNMFLSEAVGKMYVERWFPESSKQKMLTLVHNLQDALAQHVDSLEWMGDSTKVKAREKLSTFTVKIGYPDKWKDYSTLDIDPKNGYYANLRNARTWYIADNLSKLGKPTDRTEWGMPPQTVNAYYNPTTNEICFPAAILQPPFFNPDADDAVNYGGIGVVIGHEMSHGFDDQGRLFDAKGNMTNWWTKEDEEKFNEKAQVLVRQFNEVEIAPGLKANGELTLGENIGDHGGISIAWTAMQNAWNGVHPEPIDGFTAEQRFWLSYGHIWAANETPEEAARRTKLDVHSLPVNRVNVSIRNFQQFFDAFGIGEGDPMFRPESERVHIW